MILHINKTVFRIPIVVFSPVLIINTIAFEPFLESHGTHNVIIRHRIKTIECELNFLFWSKTSLEGIGSSSFWKSFPFHNLIIFKAPRLISKCINIFGFQELIVQLKFVEIKNLYYIYDTLFVNLNQSLSCCFSHTASVRKLKSPSYSEKSLPIIHLYAYPKYWNRNLLAS